MPKKANSSTDSEPRERQDNYEWARMDKYETIKAIGDGSFGSVTKARNKFNNEIVAIKRMKAQFASWDEAMKLREVKSLRKLNHHNIVKLKEVIRQ